MRVRLCVLALACALGGAAFADIVPVAGQTEKVTARIVNPKAFYPRINRSVVRYQEKSENEGTYNLLPASESSNIPVGGTLDESRVATKLSTYFRSNPFSGFYPPDPDMAVSKKGVVAVVNQTIGIYSRTGQQLLLQPFAKQGNRNGFFPQAGSFQSDPKVNFDPGTGRFFLVNLEIEGIVDANPRTSSFLIAVSDTDDPMGNWKTYKIPNKQTVNGTEFWVDYPGWGFNKDAIVTSGNMFTYDNSAQPFASIYAFKKSDLVAGTAQATIFNPGGFTIQIAKTYDDTPYVYALGTLGFGSLRMYAVNASLATPTLTTTDVMIPAWSRPGPNVGPGDIKTDASDGRILNTAYRSGRLVGSHSVSVSASDSRSAARWYEFATNGWPASGAPTLFQSGQLNPPANYTYSFPAINVNYFGDLAMTFSRISPVDGYKIMASGRKPKDPLGTMGAPVVLETGLSPTYDLGRSADRWGDYFDVEVDPKNNRSFFAIGQATDVDGLWQTFVKSFDISVGEETATVVNPITANVFNGTLIAGSNASLFKAADDDAFRVRSQSIPGIGQAAGVQATFTSPILAGNVDTFSVVVTSAGPVGGTTTLFLKNVATGAFVPVTSFPAPTSSKTIDLASVASRYIGSDGSITAVLRTVLPPRNGRSSTPFVVQYDRLGFLVTANAPAGN